MELSARVPPPVDRGPEVIRAHGHEIVDPYRNLEDAASDLARKFTRAQDDAARAYLAALPTRTFFADTVERVLTLPVAGVPWQAGEGYFVLANPGGLELPQLFTAATLEGLADAPRLVLDPNTFSNNRATTLTSLSISPDATLLAYTRSTGGSDWRTIHILDIQTGREHAEVVPWTKWVTPVWLSDSRSFLCWRYDSPAAADDHSPISAGHLALHRIGRPAESDELVWSSPAGDELEWIARPWVSGDGSLLVLRLVRGTETRCRLEARRLDRDDEGKARIDPAPLVLVDRAEATFHPVALFDEALLVRTDRTASTGALESIDLARVGGADANHWTTVVPGRVDDHGRHAVLVDVVSHPGGFVAVWSEGNGHVLESLDPAGRTVDRFTSPRPISLGGLSPIRVGSVGSELIVGIHSFDRPVCPHRVVIDACGAMALLPVWPTVDTGLAPQVVEQRHAVSIDGTAVPMWILRRSDLPEGPRPTLLHGYGGYGLALLPEFSAMFSAWVEAGGVVVVANLRGGGELGEPWHRAGMLTCKQAVFDDLFACAQELTRGGVCTSGQLAVHGRSNGGLLVSAALAQRPDLWAAALPTVGVHDMLRFDRFTVGRAWKTEFGDPDDAADFEVLRAYSPVHTLRPGLVYPPTLISTGRNDNRVDPVHSRKLAAALQHAQAGTAPILLRVRADVGHGDDGASVTLVAAELADQLAFAAEHTGLTPGGSGRRHP